MEDLEVLKLLALNPYSANILIDPSKPTYLENLETEILAVVHSFSELLLIKFQKDNSNFLDISMKRIQVTEATHFLINPKRIPVILADHSLIFSKEVHISIQSL